MGIVHKLILVFYLVMHALIGVCLALPDSWSHTDL